MLRDFLEKYPAGGRRKSAGQAARLCKARWDAIMECTKMCPLHTVTVSYCDSVFRGNRGKEISGALMQNCFVQGGLQYQPNVLDVQTLYDAQRHPENDPDLIVRLWGVSAHFVKLPKELQDEMIARLA